MNDTNHTDTRVRPITPKELASFVSIYRQSLGWTQETLAEISGLTVRTIQRVEKGDASSVDTRRALARALQVEDIDAFNKPYAFKSAEQIKAEADELQRLHMTMPISVATSGKHLADLTEDANMRCFQPPEDVTADVGKMVALIYDLMSDYGEISDAYSFSQKLELHATFDEQLSELKGAGYSLCYSLRKTSIVGKNWVDKTPMPVGIAYAIVVKLGDEPKFIAVPKSLNL